MTESSYGRYGMTIRSTVATDTNLVVSVQKHFHIYNSSKAGAWREVIQSELRIYPTKLTNPYTELLI